MAINQNPFLVNSPQQQQAQQPSINPLQALNMYQTFAGGGQAGGLGSVLGGGGAGSAATGATSATGATGAAGAAGSGASGLGGMAASAGPWVALAAAIYANESFARDKGYRAEDDKEYAEDLLRGEVITQDLEQRFLPKVFGTDWEENDKLGLGADMLASSQLASLNFDDAFKTFTEKGLLSKIFG